MKEGDTVLVKPPGVTFGYMATVVKVDDPMLVTDNDGTLLLVPESWVMSERTKH